MKDNQFKFATTLITCGNQTGTGFFALFSIENKPVPVLVTTKHVIETEDGAPSDITLALHYQPTEEHIATASLPVHVRWYKHPEKDVCCCLVADINAQFEKIMGFPVYCRYISEYQYLTEQQRKKIDLHSRVFMSGYPLGIATKPNFYPLYQHGHLASDPADNHITGMGYADITALPGSSGSPLLLAEEPYCLIGILTGAVTEATSQNAGLGMYLDAEALLELKEEVKNWR